MLTLFDTNSSLFACFNSNLQVLYGQLQQEAQGFQTTVTVTGGTVIVTPSPWKHWLLASYTAATTSWNSKSSI